MASQSVERRRAAGCGMKAGQPRSPSADSSLVAHAGPDPCRGDSSRQRLPRFVLLSSAVNPSFRSDGASLVSCLPITEPVAGQPLGLFSSLPVLVKAVQ